MESQETSAEGPDHARAFDRLRSAPTPGGTSEGEKLDAGRIGDADKEQTRALDPEKLTGRGGRVRSGSGGSSKKRGPYKPRKPKTEGPGIEVEDAGTVEGGGEDAATFHLGPEAVSRLELLLLGIHHQLAAKNREMELNSDEAKKLADVCAKVYERYGRALNRMVPPALRNGEILDVGAILWTIWSIYAPRLAAIKIRRKMEAQRQTAPNVQRPPGATVS